MEHGGCLVLAAHRGHLKFKKRCLEDEGGGTCFMTPNARFSRGHAEQSEGVDVDWNLWWDVS